MTNTELYDRAVKAIQELHNDKSVSKEKAIENLETLKDEIEMMIEGLQF